MKGEREYTFWKGAPLAIYIFVVLALLALCIVVPKLFAIKQMFDRCVSLLGG